MVSIVRFPKDPGLKTFSPSSSPLVPFVLSRIGAAMKEGKLTTFTIANWQGHVKEQGSSLQLGAYSLHFNKWV